MKYTQLSDELYSYILSSSVKEEACLKELREETLKLPFYGMQISPDQGQFLKLITKIINAKNILDIGSFTGYSALCFAVASMPDAQIISCENHKDWAPFAKNAWKKFGYQDKICLKFAPASTSLDELIEQKKNFDIIFIDADKINYETYYEKSLKLIRKKGLIIIDNVLFHQEVIKDNKIPAAEAIKKFNKKLFDDNRVFASMIPIGDGMSIAFKL